MAIDPRAVRRFLLAERDDHAWMKRLSHKALDRELERLGFTPLPCPPDKKLGLHQKVCIILGLAYPRFAFWLDMGTGKTRISLELLNHFFKRGRCRIAIILVPTEPALISWEDQIREWKIKVPFVTLGNSPSREKWDTINELEWGLVLATYPGLTRMVTKKIVPNTKRKARAKKGKLATDKTLMKAITKNLDAMILDEATKIGTHNSLITKIAGTMADDCRWVYELAGRPFGRDPQMLWSQLNLIDNGESLGDTLGLFRAAFFKEKINFWGGRVYEFKKNMKAELARITQHRSISYSADECIDLPRLVKEIERVRLPEEAQAYYERFVKELKRTHAGFQERKNSFLRMRQVSSGFVGFKDDETGERAEVAFDQNPKLDALIELIESLPLDRKFVVFHEFTYSGRLICDALRKAKIKHEWIWGGSKDSRGIQDRFDHDDRVRGIIVNHRKGAYSLNLQRANYAVYYESPVAAIDRDQADRRVYRQGQKRTTFIIDLVCEGTADRRILDFHQEGGNLFKAVIRDPNALYAPGRAG